MLFSLTGGIGSGKSTVSKIFAEHGVAIVDADVIAHQVLQRPDVVEQVVRDFGSEVLTYDRLDRKKLGAVVFASKENRVKLESIVLPLIKQVASEEIVYYIKQGVDVCFDAPTLIESGDFERFRPIVVIDIPIALQITNVTNRGLTMLEAFARIDAQLPMAQKLKVADYVIENYNGLEELRANALETLRQLRTKHGAKGD